MTQDKLNTLRQDLRRAHSALQDDPTSVQIVQYGQQQIVISKVKSASIVPMEDSEWEIEPQEGDSKSDPLAEWLR